MKTLLLSLGQSGPWANLGVIFRVRRDLVAPIKNFVLAGSVLSIDRADLLIELLWAHSGIGEVRADANGYVTFKQLEGSLLNSQPHISRRLKDMADESWVKVEDTMKGERHHANSHHVRLTQGGLKVIQPVWTNYQELSKAIFQDVSNKDRQVHLLVNQIIRHQLRPFRDLPADSSDSHPVQNVISILKARRELVSPMKKAVLSGSGLSLEIADILTDLYGAKELHWPDPQADRDGFVTLSQLQASLVHCQTLSQILLSRRIRALEDEKWVEIRRIQKDRKYLHENDGVRITDSGTSMIRPVWAKYQELAKTLLNEVSEQHRQVHLKVSESILQRIRPAWTRLL